MKYVSGEFVNSGYGEIVFGKDIWVSFGCKILPYTFLPDRCSVACNSVCNKNYRTMGNNILIGGQPARLLKEGVYHDMHDDIVKIP